MERVNRVEFLLKKEPKIRYSDLQVYVYEGVHEAENNLRYNKPIYLSQLVLFSRGRVDVCHRFPL